jgi:Tol biopolymer transport system component
MKTKILSAFINRNVIAGIAVAVLAIALWRLVAPSPSYELRLTQLTFDPGLTGWPAISPDGRMVAYASDRDTGSNLELYVQPIRGGSPVRLTTSGENNSEPAFSPDGTTLVFYSSGAGGDPRSIAAGGHTPRYSPDGRRIAYSDDAGAYTVSSAGGGIYTVPAAGGDPHLLVAGGHTPRYSPDGGWIAYSDAAGAAIVSSAGGGIYTVPATGGDPHLLAAGGHTPRYSPDGHWIAYSDDAGAYIVSSVGGTARQFHPEVQSLRAPAWSPDGGSLIFWARDELWVAPLESGAPEPTGVEPRLAKAGLGSGPFEDALWTPSGLLFSARTGFVRNIYRCPLSRDGKAAGDVVRLTNGTELMGDAAVARDGRMVFSSGRQRFDIWGLPLDAESGKPNGPPYRITDTLAPTANPDISADGRRLIFGSSRNGFTEIREKDLATGKEWVAATSPEGASYGRLLKSSGDILCVRPAASHDDVYLVNRKLAVGTRPWDADSKGTTVLVSGAGIDALNVATRERTPWLHAPSQTKLSEASFSPDDRWVLFLAETSETSRIYVAPAGGGEWLPITDSAAKAGKPRFSPGGHLIYFTRDRGGTREIEAVRFDTQSGSAVGEAFSVLRPPAARLSLLAVNPQALEIAVARDKLVTILGESTSTIWIGDTVLH